MSSNWITVFSYTPSLLGGLKVTIYISLTALLISLVIGLIVAVFRTFPNRLLNRLGLAYVEFFQNTPLIIQVFFFYLGGPSIGIMLPRVYCGMLGLAVYTGAYIAEVFRAGIQAVPSGQAEAARSSGMTYLQAMRYVIIPQAVKIVLPPLGNQTINLVKNSAILSTIAVGDLMYQTNIASSDTFIVFEFFIFAALLYLCITVPLSQLVNLMERRFKAGH